MRKRNKKRYIGLLIRVLLLSALFAGAVAVVYSMLHKEPTRTDTEISWEDPTLPVISARVNGTYMNLMYGYVDEMVDRYMRDTVTPIDSDDSLTLKIKADQDPVTGIRYEVKSLDTTQLVENTVVKDWKAKEKEDGSSTIKVTFSFHNQLTAGEEYQLKIFLTTKAHEEICYYTRIVESENLYTEEMLKFVKSFQKKTMDPDKASGMAAYLKETTDSTNSLAFVTLHSTYKQILWDYLKPSVVGDIQVRLTDINDSIGTFILNYQVSFKDDYGKHLCNVEEVYTVQIANGTKFMLVYERSVNEELSLSAIDSSKDRIRLGIIEDDSVRVLNSEDGAYRLLSYNGDVWLNHVDEEETLSMTKLVTFHTDDEDARSTHDDYNVNLVSVDDEGNAGFFVYGYMNRGSHEGQVGLTFYQYSSENSKLKEVFFLPFDRSFSVLEREVGQLSYVSASNLFYLMINNTIYAIDFSGKEYVTVVDDLSEDALWVSDDESMIAWAESMNKYGTGTVYMYNLETGKQSKVKAAKKEAFYPIGFIGDELAVGCVKKSQQKKYSAESAHIMYAVKIFSGDGSTLATYKKKNIVITNAEVDNGSVLMERAKINNGKFTAISSDALIENVNRDTVEDELLAKTKPTDGYAVWYMKEDMKTVPEEFGTVDTIITDSNAELNINVTDTEEGLYFAYAKGKLQNICTTAAEAVSDVYDDIGYVTDSNGYYVMRRGYRNVSYLTIPETKKGTTDEEKKESVMTAFSAYEGGSYSESFASMEKEELSDVEMLQLGMDGIVYDLTGCQFSQVAYYFLNYAHPIYAVISSGPVLITGISGDIVYVWDPSTGSVVNMTFDKIESQLKKNGNILYSCMVH